jgi:hypothetical protein
MMDRYSSAARAQSGRFFVGRIPWRTAKDNEEDDTDNEPDEDNDAD